MPDAIITPGKGRKEVDVCISGGSVEGICTSVGFLKALISDLGFRIISASGNSAGGMILCIYAATREIYKVEEIILSTKFERYISIPSWWNVIQSWRVVRRGWLSNGKKLLKFLKKVTDNKSFDGVDLDLHIVGSNLSRNRLEIFNSSMYPEMPLAVAARITGSLPGGFKPVRYCSDTYWDGGPRRHYPIDCLPQSDRPLYGYLTGKIKEADWKEVDKRPGIFGTIGGFIDDAIDANVKGSVSEVSRPHLTIPYDDVNVGTFDFAVSRDEKERLIEAARKKTVDMIKASEGPLVAGEG